jgi:hypothetical protein
LAHSTHRSPPGGGPLLACFCCWWFSTIWTDTSLGELTKNHSRHSSPVVAVDPSLTRQSTAVGAFHHAFTTTTLSRYSLTAALHMGGIIMALPHLPVIAHGDQNLQAHLGAQDIQAHPSQDELISDLVMNTKALRGCHWRVSSTSASSETEGLSWRHLQNIWLGQFSLRQPCSDV